MLTPGAQDLPNMTSTTKAILSSWSIDPGLALALSVSGLIYIRGWIILHRLTPALFRRWRLLSFLAGLVIFWLAVNSPLDALSSLLLSAHMVQHILLLMVVPPLLLLGFPVLPLLRGLPRSLARDGVAPFLHCMPLRKMACLLTAPAVCWVLMTINPMRLAYPRRIRTRAPLIRLAQSRACLFYKRSFAVLVAGRAPVPLSIALAAMVHTDLSPRGRPG